MSEVIESGVGTINYVPQSAKGSVPTAASTAVGTNRPKAANGTELKPNKRGDSEEYVDGNAWGSPSQYTVGTGGQVGQVVIQPQPENAPLFLAQLVATDVVTGAGDPYTHTITTGATSGKYGGWYQKTGSVIGPARQLYWDSKIGKLTWECGQEQYTAHMTMEIMALKPSQAFATDPAKTEDTSDPYLWSESDGQVVFDATTLGDVNGEVFEFDTGMEAYWGNSMEPAQLVAKKGIITRTLKTVVTDDTLLKFNKAVYNNTAPSAGDRPVKDVFYASIVNKYARSATRYFQITTPRVAIKADDLAVGPRAEGGTVPIEFGGQCLKSGATPAATIVALTGDATSYAA
jgi:hypothetical protein